VYIIGSTRNLHRVNPSPLRCRSGTYDTVKGREQIQQGGSYRVAISFMRVGPNKDTGGGVTLQWG